MIVGFNKGRRGKPSALSKRPWRWVSNSDLSLQTREMSFQVRHLLATWSPGKAAIKHHWQVLIPLGLQAHLCLDWNSAVQLLTVKHNPSCFKFLLLSNVTGHRRKQVA